MRDNGRGLPPDPAPGRFGLVGMRERVAELHGELRLDTPPGGGLRVRARLPYTPSIEENADDLHA